MTAPLSILDAATDENLFAPWFTDREHWQAWFAFLAALFALPMTAEQLAIYQRCTGRTEPPAKPETEAWMVIGRRGGKSLTMALIATYLAVFRDYAQYLAPGERATIMVIAADRKQARVVMRYVKGFLALPMLDKLVERETAESFDLTNRVTIEVNTASFRSVRGYTIPVAIADEIAFWRSDESANPDTEILDALRPAMATIPGAMLLCASSPYARRGALWEAYRRHYGKEGAPALIWKAPTRTMNPTVPQLLVDEAIERDAASASAEYLAEFRTDVESYISHEAVRACIEPGIRERAPERRNRYIAFVDPSGGSHDSMTMAVAHREGDTAILDAVREVTAPFKPEQVVEEFADLARRYRIVRVTGDRYAGEWCREQFRRCGLNYELADKPKSDLYRDLLPAINSGAVDLLDHERMVNQLIQLERRTGRGGRDSIDHPPGGRDDVANAVAGVVVMATKQTVSRPDRRPISIENMSTFHPFRTNTRAMSR